MAGLAESRGHPSASHLYEQIHRQFPTTSPATVYKTLALLKDMGEVLELGFSDDDNRYDGSQPKPHPHLICVCCRAIIDPKFSLGHDLDAEASGETGYQVLGHRLDFYGMCPECQTSESEAPLGSDRCAGPEEGQPVDPQHPG